MKQRRELKDYMFSHDVNNEHRPTEHHGILSKNGKYIQHFNIGFAKIGRFTGFQQ